MSQRVRCPCPVHNNARVSRATRKRCALAYPASFPISWHQPAAAAEAAAAAAIPARAQHFAFSDEIELDGGGFNDDEEEEKHGAVVIEDEEEIQPQISEDELYAEIEEAETEAAEAEAAAAEMAEQIDEEAELNVEIEDEDQEESKDEAVDMELDILPMDAAVVGLDAAIPIAATAAAAAAVDAPAEFKRGPGRPCREKLKLHDPVWLDGPPVASHSLKRLLSDLFTVAANNNLTEKAATDLFSAVQLHLPQSHTMPSYAHAVDELLRNCPVVLHKYVACPYDCELYSLNPDSNNSERQIPCALKDLNPDQLKSLSTACCVHGHKFCDDKKRVQKTFLYLGLTERLRMMCEDPVLSKHMRLPSAGVQPPAAVVNMDDDENPGPGPAAVERDSPHGIEPTLDGSCRNLYESVGWWKDVHMAPGPGHEPSPGQPDRRQQFGANRCNIALSLNIDGVQPFDRGGVSILPFVCMVLNLPENLRHRWQHLILAAVVPGPKAPKNLNTYLHVLVTELLDLWWNGFTFTDPYDQSVQTARVKLLFTCMDYPAHADANCQTKQGSSFGCQKCDVKGTSRFGRQCYGDYKKLNTPDAPSLLTKIEYTIRADRFKRLSGPPPRGRTKKEWEDNRNFRCKQVAGKSPFCRLPYFDIVEHTLLDMMHLVQGVVGAHLVPLVKGDRLKSAIASALSQRANIKGLPKQFNHRDIAIAPVAPDSASSPAPPPAPLPPRPYGVTKIKTSQIVSLLKKNKYGQLPQLNRFQQWAVDQHNKSPPEVQLRRIQLDFVYDVHDDLVNAAAEVAVSTSGAAAAAASSSPARATSSANKRTRQSVSAYAFNYGSSSEEVDDDPDADYCPNVEVESDAESHTVESDNEERKETQRKGARSTAGSSVAAASSASKCTRAQPAAAAAASAVVEVEIAVANKRSKQAAKALTELEKKAVETYRRLTADVALLQSHRERFPQMTDLLMAHVESTYRAIRAPIHIAPASKMPFQRSGEMTAHHWLNFAKCHGSILLRSHFNGSNVHDAQTMLTLRTMLDLISLCLRSHVTAEVKAETSHVQQSVAATFEEDWPETEHAIVMHLLIFHMPVIIRKWGPVRGYWCFPFERMIGKLSSSIKNRRYPEINLINRYMLNLATHHSDVAADADAAAADAEYQLSHPLVITAHAVNSSLRPDQVFWPAATKNNRRRAEHDGKQSHARTRYLTPILGMEECQLHAGKNDAFIMWNYRISLQVGRWKYNTAQKEQRDHGQVGKSRTSWFRIRAKNVPNWNADALKVHEAWVKTRIDVEVATLKRHPIKRPNAIWNDETFVYGRIEHFALLEMQDPRWAQSYQLAKVRLYHSFAIDSATQLPLLAFDLDQLHFTSAESTQRRPIEHVPVQFLDAPIGIAPMGRLSCKEASQELWYVLPVDPC